MWSFIPKMNFKISISRWFYYKKNKDVFKMKDMKRYNECGILII